MGKILFSGIDGQNGGYFQPPLELPATGWSPPERSGPMRGAIAGVDPEDLSQAGWAVLLPANLDKEREHALRELLEFRREQAGELYLELRLDADPEPSLKSVQLLLKQNTTFGPADPSRLPYYILLVGPPEQIPFRLQAQLGIQRAVGRLWFERAEDYRNYAHNVVAAERGEISKEPKISFFGPLQDELTKISATDLIRPLQEGIASGAPDWSVTSWIGERAGIREMRRLMGGEETPALLLTAGHALAYQSGAEDQLDLQGALVCQDWPGPYLEEPDDYYFCADDLDDDADLRGLIAFHFGCFTLGSPAFDSYSDLQRKPRRRLAPRAFLSRLPTRMLSHPRGALAVIGHVDQAFCHSFRWKDLDPQVQTFGSLLLDLTRGVRVGGAMEYFGVRYAELSTEELETRRELEIEGRDSREVDPFLRMAARDAGNYAILGDPAVRLSVARGHTGGG